MTSWDTTPCRMTGVTLHAKLNPQRGSRVEAGPSESPLAQEPKLAGRTARVSRSPAACVATHVLQAHQFVISPSIQEYLARKKTPPT